MSIDDTPPLDRMSGGVSEIGPEAIAGMVPASSGSRLRVGPAYLAVHESVKDEMTLSGSGSDEQVQLLRDRHDGALTMKYSGTSPHYNDGNTVMSTPVDMTVAAVLLGVEPDELTPVVEAAGRTLGSARDRIDASQSGGSLSSPKVWSYAEIKAVARRERARKDFDGGAEPVGAGDESSSPATWRELREQHRPASYAHNVQALPPDLNINGASGPSIRM